VPNRTKPCPLVGSSSIMSSGSQGTRVLSSVCLCFAPFPPRHLRFSAACDLWQARWRSVCRRCSVFCHWRASPLTCMCLSSQHPAPFQRQTPHTEQRAFRAFSWRGLTSKMSGSKSLCCDPRRARRSPRCWLLHPRWGGGCLGASEAERALI